LAKALRRVSALVITLILLLGACQAGDTLRGLATDVSDFFYSLLPQQRAWQDPVGTERTDAGGNSEIEAPPSRHYYNRLSEAQKQAYEEILKAMPAFPQRIELPELDKEELAETVKAYSYDNPDRFNLGDSYTFLTQGKKRFLEPNYRFGKEEYEIALQKTQTAIETFMKVAPVNGSDFEKELAVHDYLTARVLYQSDGQPYEATAYGALVLGKASCEGYARAAKLLLEALGIESLLNTGNATNSGGTTQAHMWNCVKVDGQWYQLDVTWDDPGTDNGGVRRYDYFNLTDAELALTHAQRDELVKCTSTAANYFRYRGLYFNEYNTAAKNAVSAAVKNNVKEGNYQVELRFSSTQVLLDEYEKLISSTKGDIYRMLETAALASDVRLVTNEINYSLNEQLGIIRIIFRLKY
jgi:hypothetical protein